MAESSKARKIAGLIALVLIIASLIWVYYNLRPTLPKEEIRRYQAFGTIGILEIKKLIGDKTDIVFLRPASSNNPYDYSKLELEALQQASDALGLHLLVEPYASGTIQSEFFAAIRKHPDAGAIIVDDLPLIDAGGWKQIAGKPRPKIIQHGADEITVKQYLQAHLIDMAFVYRPQGKSDSKVFNNDQECFDYYYKILEP